MAHHMKPSSQRYGTSLSNTVIRSDRYDVNSNPSEKTGELEQIKEDAENAADSLISELTRCASEYRALTPHLKSVLSPFRLNRAELHELPKCSAADIALVRLACRGDAIEEEITFGKDALRSAEEARAERSLERDIRRVMHRNSRLREEVSYFKKVFQTVPQLRPADSMDVREWRAEAAFIEEKTKVLRKKLTGLKVPSQSSLQKGHDECIALKEKLSAAQQRLKKFDGLPPSLTEAAQKLDEVRKELNNVRLELRNSNAHSYGITFTF